MSVTVFTLYQKGKQYRVFLRILAGHVPTKEWFTLQNVHNRLDNQLTPPPLLRPSVEVLSSIKQLILRSVY